MRTIPRQGGAALSDPVTDEELAGLVQRVAEAAQALISGDIEGYATRMKHAHDYTLMSPYGGDPVRGFDDSDGALDALGRFFRGGEAQIEVVETYTSGDLAVLVAVERQHGTIGDLPEQDWSLRVTWVFRRTAESDWEVVHRHADALVHAIDHERLGELARGE
jgi:ketosteroid isomerase-like protein